MLASHCYLYLFGSKTWFIYILYMYDNNLTVYLNLLSNWAETRAPTHHSLNSIEPQFASISRTYLFLKTLKMNRESKILNPKNCEYTRFPGMKWRRKANIMNKYDGFFIIMDSICIWKKSFLLNCKYYAIINVAGAAAVAVVVVLFIFNLSECNSFVLQPLYIIKSD